eukprot:19344-Heterococcus_DN1.PRE.3
MSKQVCCFCPPDSEAGEGTLIGPILKKHSTHDAQLESYDKQLYAHLNCLRATSTFDAGPCNNIPAEVLQLLVAHGLEGKHDALTVEHPAAIGTFFAPQLLQGFRRSRIAECKLCKQFGASVTCCVRGCNLSTHLMCAQTVGLLIATPALCVGGSMRGSTWMWLCPKHQYGRQQLDVEHPQPRPGNVCVSVQDLHEDIYGALADMWPSPVVLPLGVPAGASAVPAGADHDIIFSDYELYTVPDALLLHPLQLPELME